MPLDKLRATLEELHHELQAADDLDAASRELLEGAASEIAARLGQEREEPHALGDVLGDAALSFEVSHPALSALIRRLVDSLSATGI